MVIPVYNEINYIYDCLNSFESFDSTIYSLEIIVVDDFSEDDTYNFVKSKIHKFKNKVVLYRNVSKGKVNAYNLGVSYMSGDYLLLIGGDDLIVSTEIANRISIIKSDSPSISLCKIKTFSKNKRFDNIVYPKNNDKGASSGGAMVMNRKMVDLAFPIPNTLPNEDTWLKIFIDINIPHIFHHPVVGLFYRIHQGNSVKLNSSFEHYSKLISDRNKAYSLFLDNYDGALGVEQRDFLIYKAKLEACRYSGRFLKIIFMRKVGFRDKISSLLLSNSFFYSIRSFAYKFLAGR